MKIPDVISLININPQACKVCLENDEYIALQYVEAITRAEKSYYLENATYTTNLLLLGINPIFPAETCAYNYEIRISTQTDGQNNYDVFEVIAYANYPNLSSFYGYVFTQSGGGNSFYMGICWALGNIPISATHNVVAIGCPSKYSPAPTLANTMVCGNPCQEPEKYALPAQHEDAISFFLDITGYGITAANIENYGFGLFQNCELLEELPITASGDYKNRYFLFEDAILGKTHIHIAFVMPCAEGCLTFGMFAKFGENLITCPELINHFDDLIVGNSIALSSTGTITVGSSKISSLKSYSPSNSLNIKFSKPNNVPAFLRIQSCNTLLQVGKKYRAEMQIYVVDATSNCIHRLTPFFGGAATYTNIVEWNAAIDAPNKWKKLSIDIEVTATGLFSHQLQIINNENTGNIFLDNLTISEVQNPAIALFQTDYFKVAHKFCDTLLMRFNEEGTHFRIPYSSNANTPQQFRLHIALIKPNTSTQRTEYEAGAGQTFLVRASIKKTYELETAYFHDTLHEGMQLALNHRILEISDDNGQNYTAFILNSEYKASWENLYPRPSLAKAAAVLKVNPYNKINNLC